MKRVSQPGSEVNAREALQRRLAGFCGSGVTAESVPDLMAEVTFQGRLIKCKVGRPDLPQVQQWLVDAIGELPVSKPGKKAGGRRGKVVGFSRGSRKRMLDHGAATAWPERGRCTGIFQSLTVGSSWPDAEGVRRWVERYLQAVCRKYPDHGHEWRLDLQERGAPHLHILTCGLKWFDVKWGRSTWEHIIGWSERKHVQFHVREVENGRHAMSYLSRYLAKRDGGAEGRCEAGAPAPEGLKLVPVTYPTTEGRCWGLRNRAKWPMANAARVKVAIHGGRYTWFLKLKGLVGEARAAWQREKGRPGVWRGLSGVEWTGFTVYGDEDEWFALFEQCLCG